MVEGRELLGQELAPLPMDLVGLAASAQVELRCAGGEAPLPIKRVDYGAKPETWRDGQLTTRLGCSILATATNSSSAKGIAETARLTNLHSCFDLSTDRL